MPYATQQDMIDLYGSNAVIIAADRDGNGVADTTAVSKALSHASELMDSYLGRQYDLPITRESEELVSCCVDIAMYKLANEATVLTEEKRARYKDSLDWLKDIAKGLATLGQSVEPEPAAGLSFEFDTAPRAFTRTSMRGL